LGFVGPETSLDVEILGLDHMVLLSLQEDFLVPVLDHGFFLQVEGGLVGGALVLSGQLGASLRPHEGASLLQVVFRLQGYNGVILLWVSFLVVALWGL
jgi:hypothetical protein